MTQAINDQMLSDSAMDVDEDDYGVVPPENEDITLTNTDEASEQLADLPTADDYEGMKSIVLPPLQEDPPIITDVVHTWHLERWTELPQRHHGPVFEAGGYPWRVLMFPAGNHGVQCSSFYLEHAFPDGKVPDDWYCCMQFALVLWNPKAPQLYHYSTAVHRFTKEESDWGFTRFCELRKLFNVEWNGSGRPLVENGEANMSVYARIVKDETGVLWHSFANYDSKKETGYVGLKNQGATCYLNSLLQSLYFTNAFRKAVYQIPTENEENLTNSAYTLQRLFYHLQTSPTAVSTNELTKSFGWETRHIFEQQDVQELSRKLMERMEEKMKGTAAENVLPDLFSGKVKTYISCINVDYESSRIEDFWDVQLNVRGNKTIEDSFKDYVQVEKMEGENQYFAGDDFKLQDANKGVIFQSFPEVLHLQLKRFEYDIERDDMMKINDRYEFPETFDASPYLSDEADKSEPWVYQLHGVLVHSGTVDAGHYYAFIKPTKDGCFYRYDDDKVIKASMREVVEDNFGGEMHLSGAGRGPLSQPPVVRLNSAYMLVYIRQSRLDNVLLPVEKEDIPPHLQRKLREEAVLKEALIKEKEEQHLYLTVRVVTEETYQSHSGTDLTMFERPSTEPGAARSYRVLKSSSLKDLANRVAEDTGKDPKALRFWSMVNRQNKTIRPDAPITEITQSMEQLHQKLVKIQEIRLWVEEAQSFDDDGRPIWYGTGGLVKNDNILLFLKWFDVDKQALKGIGHFYVSKERKVEDLIPLIIKKMGWPEKNNNGEKLQLTLFEEIKPQMIDRINEKQSLKDAELQDGDIICFQKTSSTRHAIQGDRDPRGAKSFSSLGPMIGLTAQNPRAAPAPNGSLPQPFDRIDDPQHFYDYLLHRKVVHLSPLPSASQTKIAKLDVEMSSKFSYDQVAAKVGEKLGINPTHLRFYPVSAANGNPKAPIKRNPTQTLGSILNPSFNTFGNNNQKSDELYFEVLDMSLAELDTKKVLKVVWLSDGISKDETFDVLVPKTGSIGDIITALIHKANLDDEKSKGPIRLYAIHNSKFHKELKRESSIGSNLDYTTLVAERIPEEDLNGKPEDFIYAYHFQGELTKAHGYPFKFLMKPDEKFVETKKRLEKRTGIKGKNFEKIKFAVVRPSSYSRPVYLHDDDVLWELAPNRDEFLGLDHADRTSRLRNGASDLFLK